MNYPICNIIGYCGKQYSLDLLRELCPSHSEIIEQKKIEGQTHQSRTFHSKRYNSEVENLPEEIWVRLSQKGWNSVFVSNKARIKVIENDQIKHVLQYDSSAKNEEIGYLVVKSSAFPDENREYHVYTLVAMAFLGKESYEGDGIHVHHINNDGYNCCPENLILLNRTQHFNQVHHN